MASPERKRANNLDGKRWTRYSVSVWSDIKKTPEEAALKHPAMFPAALPRRLIECFAAPGNRVVLDPFAGVGSTLIAAAECGMTGLGLELSPDYHCLARSRLQAMGHSHSGLRQADARDVARHVEAASVDLIITSPPYWDILSRPRTADRKAARPYRTDERDLARIGEYPAFLAALREVFAGCWHCLRQGGYALVVVMDLRKRDQFFPLHADVAAIMQEIGFLFDDLIIWDRRQEYNALRPLGYPSVFRINKAHEYVLIFRKPPARREPAKRSRRRPRGAG
jgi:DNA modification methylase